MTDVIINCSIMVNKYLNVFEGNSEEIELSFDYLIGELILFAISICNRIIDEINCPVKIFSSN